MTLQFEFKKDWSNGQVSFKSKQVLNGEIIEDTANPPKPPYTVSNPRYNVEFKSPTGTARVPFCYDSGEAIIEPTAAPWFCPAQGFSTQPPPGTTTKGGDDYKGPVQSIGAKIFSTRNIIIALVIIAIIVLYLKYGRKKKV